MQPTIPTGKHRRLERVRAWVRAHPARTYAIAGAGLVLAGGLTAMAILWQQPEPAPAPVVKKTVKPTPPPKYYSPLTGELVKTQAATTKPATAIMIENSPDARPQSGLKNAEVVYEAVAEGGITRFLALYQQKEPGLIGPVRSLRMYYVDWLTPYNASVAHVGGSAAALKVVRSGGYRDIDQFFNPNSYYRSADRYAPHNVYTTFKRLKQLNASKGYKTSKPVPFDRADDKAKLPQNATQVSLDISGPLYNSSYKYNPKTKLYARSQAGAPHIDREDGQITAKVVIALRVNMQRVMEDGYRESIATTGKGEAMIFQNGNAIKATWRKNSRTDQLYFTDANRERIQLARGTTWISAIPTSGGNVTWQ